MKTFFLVLFLIGVAFLTLSGFGKYTSYLIDPNFRLLPIGLVLVTPYFVSIVYDYFFQKRRFKKELETTTEKAKMLLKTGRKMEINLMKSVIDIYEVNNTTESEIGEILDILLPIKWLKEISIHQHENLSTKIKFQYKIDDVKYYKEVKLPYKTESVNTYFTLQKTTLLYYDEKNPKESIIDFGFIEDYSS